MERFGGAATADVGSVPFRGRGAAWRHLAAAVAFLAVAVASLAAGPPVGAAAPGEGGGGAFAPPRRPGAVDGYLAMGVWVADESGKRFLDPSAFTVHLMPRSDPGRELVFPAGTWVLPSRQADVFRLWVEGRGRISPQQWVLHWRLVRATPERPGMVPSASPTVPGARVDWPCRAGSARTLRLWVEQSVKIPDLGNTLPAPFVRRVPCGTAEALVPPGTVLAAVHDDTAGGYVAVARPVPVAAGQTRTLDPRPPAAPASDVLVRLRRPHVASPEAGSPPVAVPELRVDGGVPLQPAHLIRGSMALTAVWYGVTGKVGTVRVSSKEVWAEPVELALPSGGVASAEVELHPLPSLHVDLDLPDELLDQGWKVQTEVWRPGADKPLATRPVRSTVVTQTFERLQPEKLSVALAAGPWRWRKEADLSTGEDGRVSFHPDLIHVHGTVYRGGDPVRATVGFSTGGDRETTTTSDEDGRYRIVLFDTSYYMVTVRLEGLPSPWVEMPQEPFAEDREYDIHIPGNRFSVLVVSAQDGTPIAGAAVMVASRSDTGVANTTRAVTGDDGRAALPPLRPGAVTLTARAEGYRAATVEEQVPEDAGKREIELRLEPEAPGARLLLRLADGRPAGGAAVFALAPQPPHQPVWNGRAAGDGSVEVPQRVAGSLLAVRHPEGGLLLAPMPPAGEEPVPVTLPAAAPPLVLELRRAGGAPPRMPFVRLSLKVGPYWLTWPGTLTVILPRPSVAGSTLTLTGLPAAPVAVVAWQADPGLAAAAASGGLGDRATALRPPWPGPVPLEIVEP